MLLIAALLATGEVYARDPMVSTVAIVRATTSAPGAGQPPGPAQPTVTSRPRHTKGDSLEGMNRALFKFHQGIDKALFRPLALFYKHVVPKPLRTAMRHILSNLSEPLVFMNDTLQLKPKRALKTLSRFVINSTLGVGGTLDIAKTADLPHHDNSLGNTLARYGVGPGPYLFIPFLGPTDLRDLLGGQAENLIYPLAIGFPFDRTDYQISSGLVQGLDLRAQSDPDFKALLDGAVDPYATLRSVFQQSRAAEIAEIKGEAAKSALDDPLIDPEPSGADNAPPSDDVAPLPEPVVTDPTSPEPTAPAITPASAEPSTAPAPPVILTEPGDTKTPDPAPTPTPNRVALHTL